MITLQKSGDSAVKFVFEDSQHYLYGNGEIEVPVNSLILVEDSSDMATFKKIDGDTFISALYSEFGMTKAELESFYKENMVGGGVSVDPSLDSGSTNPVANSAITEAVKMDKYGLYTDCYPNEPFSASSYNAGAVSGDVRNSKQSVDITLKVCSYDDTPIDDSLSIPYAYNATGETQYITWQIKSNDIYIYPKDGYRVIYLDAFKSGTSTRVSNKCISKWDLRSLLVKDVLTAHTADKSVHVTSNEKSTWNGKQDALVAGDGISISGNVISSEGIDSGAVESIVEDYMTDPNYVASSAMTAEIYVGATGYTKWYTENDFIRLTGDTLGTQGYIVPTSDPYGYGTGDKYLYLNGVLTITDDFKEYLAVSGKSVSHLQPSGTKLVLVIKSEYASAITDSYKAYDIWYGFDEIPTKPTLFEEISGATYGTQWACQGTSFANVSGKRYLVMNPLALRETSELGLTNPLDLSGFDTYDDFNRIYLSANGVMEYTNCTVIGGYMLVLMVTYNDNSEKAVLMPLSNTGSVGRWGNGDQYTNSNKRISYDLQMDKQYEVGNLTDLYNKVGSAQTTANSGLSIANQALNQANINRSHIVQVDWNQNDSGSTNYDYIKNRPMWKEKSFSDDGKIYESDPIMSFQLNDYEITLDSPLAVGDEVRVKSSSRYGQQTMFTDSIKVNSGTLPQGSYYCGSYDPMSTWSSKYMWSNDLQTWYVYNQMFDYEASIVIIKAADVYHKLDSQYIGDDIARTSEIPAITSAVTSASTDSEIPTAKAVYDAMPQGGGGMDEDMEKLISSALVDLNDRKIDASEAKSNYQKKGDYATKSELSAKANASEVMALGKSKENELVTAQALNQINERLIALEEAMQALQNNG